MTDTPQSVDEVLAADLENLGFDDWKALFEQSPERFDACRKRMLEHQITLAPEDSRQRLRGLMFQMDCESVKARSPLSYNLRLYAMMMEQFEELRRQLQVLCAADANAVRLKTRQSATIIPFQQAAKPSPSEA